MTLQQLAQVAAEFCARPESDERYRAIREAVLRVEVDQIVSMDVGSSLTDWGGTTIELSSLEITSAFEGERVGE